MSGRFQISIVAVVAFVIVRVAIGWHFLYEGTWKYRHAKFTAEPFLKQARGPFAVWYRELIPDYYGDERLSQERMSARWEDLRDRYVLRYNFSDEQKQSADGALQRRKKQLSDLIQEASEDEQKNPILVESQEVVEYQTSLENWREKAGLATTREIPFESERQWKKWQEIQGKIAPLLASVSKVDEAFADDLRRMVTPAQRQSSVGSALGFSPDWVAFSIGAAIWWALSCVLFYVGCWVSGQSPPGLFKALALVTGANVFSLSITFALLGLTTWLFGRAGMLLQFDVLSALGLLALLVNFAFFVGVGGRMYAGGIPSDRGPRIAGVQGGLHLLLAVAAYATLWLRLLEAEPAQWTRLDILEAMTTYGLIIIGICLMVGLFTRLAALGGAIFLLTAVVLAQVAWPGYYPQLPPSAGHSLIINKEVIEMLVLFALATTHVGRWGGLDFFVHYLVTLPIFGKGRGNA